MHEYERDLEVDIMLKVRREDVKHTLKTNVHILTFIFINKKGSVNSDT